MTRRLGVLVAMLALAGTAAADKTPAKKPAPAAKKDAAKDPAKGQASTDEAAPAGDEAAPPAEESDPYLKLPHVEGPKLVDLGFQSEIDLPAGFLLWQGEQAKEIMRQEGNDVEGTIAVMFKADSAGTWGVVIDYDDRGYVSDDDADELDASSLLSDYQKGTLAQNAQRKQMGLPELFIDGWSEKPAYHKAQHQLVWGLDAHSTNGKSINFFTNVLGRNGLLSVDLIGPADTIAQAKQEAAPLFAGLRFKKGARYEEHEKDDKSSGVGLRALILGGTGVGVVAAAKGGGFFVALLLILKKGIIVVVAAVGGFFKWLFGKKKNNLPPSDPMPPGPGPSNDPPPNV